MGFGKFIKRKLNNYADLSENKNKSKDVQEIFTDIYKTHGFGGQSLSGPGSDLIQTKTIIRELPRLFKELEISTLLDVPCGDFNWLKETDLGSTLYVGVDIVDDIVDNNKQNYGRENIAFTKMNILEDTFSEYDLILCRDLLVHFSFKDIFRTIDNIISNKSKFLLTTSFTSLKENRDIFMGDWRPINLLIPPFSLPKPIKVINEKCTEADGKFADKSLLLWKIDDLKKLKLSN